MDHRSSPLNALRTFESVARNLSFSGAAKELGVTHGAVSRQIAALEAMLNLRLFVRGQRIELTAEGSELFAGVAPSLDRIRTTMASLMQTGDLLTLAVNAPPTFTMKWLIPRLSVFQRRYSHAEIRLTTGTINIRALKLSDYNIVIRRLIEPLADLHSTPFLSGRLVAVCAPELLDAQPVTCAADMAKHRLIEAATNVFAWDHWYAKVQCPKPLPASFLRFEEMFFVLQAALEGLGIALVPLSLVADDLAAHNLVIVLDGPDLSGVDYACVVTPGGRNRDLCMAFSEWLIEEGKSSNQLGRSVLSAESLRMETARSLVDGTRTQIASD